MIGHSRLNAQVSFLSEYAPASVLAFMGCGIWIFTPLARMDFGIWAGVALFGAFAWRPALAPLFLGATIPAFPATRQVGFVAFSLPEITLFAAAAAIAVRPRLATVPRSLFGAPIALWLIAALASLLVSEYPLLSVRELRALIVEPLLLFLLIRAFRPLPSAPLALAGFVAGAAILASAALFQVMVLHTGTDAEGVLRAQGWYPSPNHLALTLGRAWPVALAALLFLRNARVAAAILALLFATALALTFSLGAWIGAAISSLVVLAARGYRRPAALTAALAGATFLMVSVLALAGILPERFNPLRQTAGFRLELWRSSLAMLSDHPILGVGLDNFVYLYSSTYLREGAAAEPNLNHPHNWILHVWVELGLSGLFAFLWIIICSIRLAIQSLRSHATGPGFYAASVLGILAATLSHGLLDNSYFLTDLAAIFWITVAVAESAAERSRQLSIRR